MIRTTCRSASSDSKEETAAALSRLEILLTESYYAEFFWFPNNGLDEGYWENCFRNDGVESESGRLNDQLESRFQVASTFLFDLLTDVLAPLLHLQISFREGEVSEK